LPQNLTGELFFMNRLTLALVVASLAGIAAADTTVDLAAGLNMEVKVLGGTLKYTTPFGPGSAAIKPTGYVKVVKATGTLNCDFDLYSLFPDTFIRPSGGGTAPITLVGTNLGGGKFRWTATAPALINQNIVVNIGGNQASIKVTGLSGQLNENSFKLAYPVYDVYSAVYRTVGFRTDSTAVNSFTMTGSSAFGPVSISPDPFNIVGTGGVPPPVFANAVKMLPAIPVGGATINATVQISKVAPAAGTTVALSIPTAVKAWFDAAHTLKTKSVTVPSGAITKAFTVYSGVTNVVELKPIQATLNGYTGLSNPIFPLFRRVTVSPLSVVGGNPATGTVTLNGPAPVGGATMTLSLTVANPNVVLPASVHVVAGAMSATFPITTHPVASTNTVHIKASFATSAGPTDSICTLTVTH
jgi:hypothetical protein